jgi:hypothetical protein
MAKVSVGSSIERHVPDPVRSGRLTQGRSLSLLALGLLLAATFFFLGDIGHFNDDYFYLQRDPVTHEVRTLLLDRHVHVWRPLFRLIMPAMQTLLWDHAGVMHALSTVLHGLVVVQLYRLLVRIGISWRIAAVSATLFLVYPAHSEAIFWLCCIPTLIACNLVLVCMHMQLSWLEREQEPDGIARLYPVFAGVLAFAVASLNEQPAGALALMPAMLFIARPPETLTLAARWKRTLVPSIFAAAALIIYIECHFAAMAPAPAEPVSMLHRAHGILTRIEQLVDRAPGEFLLHDYARGAFTHGLAVLFKHPWHTAGFALLMTIGTVLAARTWLGRNEPSSPSSEVSATNIAGHFPFRLMFVGALWVCASWAPIVLIHASTSSRLHYPSNLGLAMLLAGALQLLTNVFARSPRQTPALILAARLLGGITALALCSIFAIMMIAQQDLYRLRSNRDASEAAQLRGLVPDAPPNTIFLPIRIDSAVATTGSKRFDTAIAPAWCWEYAAGWNLQQVFKRSDVHTALVGPNVWLKLHTWPEPGPERLLMLSRIADPKPPVIEPSPYGVGKLLPLDTIVPFSIDASGHVALYSGAVIVKHPGDTAILRTIEFPLAAVALRRHRLPPRLLTLTDPPERLMTPRSTKSRKRHDTDTNTDADD